MPYKDKNIAKQKSKEYYQKNREYDLNRNRKWVKNNPEKVKLIKDRYVFNNPEKRKESWSKYNNSTSGKNKKRFWYRKWAENLGIKSWEEWLISRKSKNINTVNYSNEFNQELKDKIRYRDNYCCQICSITEALSKILWKRSLTVHHIDYDKKNCNPKNLSTLCCRCNSKVNYYKNYWNVFYKNKIPKIFVVIPTIREKAIKTMLSVWEKELKSTTILVIEDNNKKTFDLGEYNNVIHFSYEDIEKDLGNNSWIIPRKTSAICSYGFYKAYKLGADVIIKMDDDLIVRENGFIEKHLENLFTSRPLYWMNIFNSNHIYPRGFPYTERIRPTVLNYGLADNILDLDASTQFLGQNGKLPDGSRPIPYGCYAPISGMNVSFLSDIVPAYYYTLQGEKWGIDRFDDIWAGIFLKKITDHIGHVISFGEPIITHNKLSDPVINLYKESGGTDINEILWEELDKITLVKFNYKDCFIELSKKLKFPVYKYGNKLKTAMFIWANLF